VRPRKDERRVRHQETQKNHDVFFSHLMVIARNFPLPTDKVK
jgi:hypothetical protein